MLNLASIPLLLILPGAWLVFGQRSTHLSFLARLVLAVALSPPTVAIQFYFLRLAGLTFEQVVPTLQVINLGSLLLILRVIIGDFPRISWRSAALGGSVYAVVAGCVAIPWIWNSDFRRYSWHGLMHTDIVYTFARGALLPEEPELAGVFLAYPWVGHVFWSILAWSADLSPTIVYLVTNLTLLGATGILYYRTARQLGASESSALAAPVILALGTNIVGFVGWSIVPANDNGIWWAILGDLRYAPFLLKFVTFETMTFGLTLYTALVFLSVRAVSGYQGIELFLIPIVVVAIGALYPNLFPAAAVLLVGLVGVVFLERDSWSKQLPGNYLVGWVVSSVIAIIVGVLIVKLYSMGRASEIVKISSVAALAKKTIAATLALGPFIFATWWLWLSEPSQRRAPLLVLGFAAMGAMALNLVLRIGAQDEYKFLMAAGICLGAPAMTGLERMVLKTSRARWATLVACPIILVLVMISYSINRIPNHGTKPLAASEQSFWLRLAPQEPDASWTESVRNDTPPLTIVVINHPEFHTTSFTGRSLLVPSEGAKYHFGYNIASKPNMLALRGYSRELFDERYHLMRRIYSSESDLEMKQALQQLLLLGRPVALVFRPNDRRAFLTWLRTHRIGRNLFDDNHGRAVHLIGNGI